MNSGGTKLDASDLMFAAMKEAWSDIEEVIEQTTEMLNGTNLQFDNPPYALLAFAQWREVLHVTLGRLVFRGDRQLHQLNLLRSSKEFGREFLKWSGTNEIQLFDLVRSLIDEIFIGF